MIAACIIASCPRARLRLASLQHVRLRLASCPLADLRLALRHGGLPAVRKPARLPRLEYPASLQSPLVAKCLLLQVPTFARRTVGTVGTRCASSCCSDDGKGSSPTNEIHPRLPAPTETHQQPSTQGSSDTPLTLFSTSAGSVGDG